MSKRFMVSASPDLWDRFRQRAALQGWPLATLMRRFMADYAADRVSFGPGPLLTDAGEGVKELTLSQDEETGAARLP